MARPKTDHTKITLRLPPRLHLKLERAAAKNLRSLNSEIVQRLLRSRLIQIK
jgi:predicted HicB family RNase H-like nuclease